MSENWLLFLGSFVRVLSHQIRTPLSVISNELSYFEGLLPPGEAERSMLRCRQISDILNAALGPGKYTLELEDLPIERVADLISDLKYVLPCTERIRMRADLALMKYALDALRHTLSQLAKSGRVEVNLVVFDTFIDLAYSFELAFAALLPEQKFTSLTEPVCSVLRFDLVDPLYCDSILWAHGCSLRFSTAASASFHVQFPVLNPASDG